MGESISDVRAGTKCIVLLLAVVLLMGLATPVVSGLPEPASGDLEPENQLEDETDDRTEGVTAVSATSGTVDVVLRVDGPSEDTYETEDVEELRSAVEASQEPVVRSVDSMDDARVVERFWLANAVLVEVAADSDALDELSRHHAVDRVHENHRVSLPEYETEREPDVTTAAAEQNVTWGLNRVDVPEAWDTHETRGEGATVAVLDSGVDADHPDIDLYTEDPGNETYPGGWAEFDDHGQYVSNSTPHDRHAHGTHVAGTVAGENASGTAIGVAPEADLKAVKALDDHGDGTFARVVASMEWAIEQDVDVLTMSFGGAGFDSRYIDQIRRAEAAGVTVSASISDESTPDSTSPGNVYEAIAVSASDRDDEIDEDSEGEVVTTDDAWRADAPDDWPAEYVKPEVAAPGVDVRSATPGGEYEAWTGSSMANPHVAGIATLLAAQHDDPDPRAVQSALVDTATKPSDGVVQDGPDPAYGHGIVNANQTLTVFDQSGVEGTVRVDGEPVDDVRVTAGPGRATHTRDGGQFHLPLAAGNHTLTVDRYDLEETTVEVFVDGNEKTELEVGIEPELRVEVVEGFPKAATPGGAETVTLDGANVDAVSVEPVGDVALLGTAPTVNGTAVEWGETTPVDDEPVTVTVPLEENATGTIGAEIIARGADDAQSVTVGPTAIVNETVDIAVLDTEDRHGDDLQTTLAETLPRDYPVNVVTEQNLTDLMSHDTVVVQRLDDEALAGELLGAARDDQVGLVLLDQWGQDSNGVTALSASAGWPSTIEEADGAPSPVQYLPHADHPILAEKGDDEVPIHYGEYGDLAWFEGADEEVTVLASVGAESTAAGASLAVDDASDTVLAASLGRTEYVPNEAFTDDANHLLSNAVQYASGDDPEAEEPNPALDVDGTTLVQNGSGTIELTTEASEVAGFEATISYDPDVVDVVGVEGADLGEPEVNLEDGTVSVAAAQPTSVATPTLASIEVTAAPGVESATTAIELHEDETALNHEHGEEIDVTLGDGSVSVEPYLPGDVNRNGEVTAADATLVLRHVAGMEIEGTFDENLADVTDDGNVHTGDATAILRHVVGDEEIAG